MGVRGLKSFIENNDDLLIKNHRLHDTSVVIDACNLVGTLTRDSQQDGRADLFGGDMVQFGNYIKQFFDNLSSCNIWPILVFDGAQTSEASKNKTDEKKRRALERFMNVMSINKYGFGDFVLPATATGAFRSIIVDKGLSVVQCMYEADAEVARISLNLKCPVISNDSDFYLIDLPYGLIPIDLIKHSTVHRSTGKNSESKNKSITDSLKELSLTQYNYINCSIFYQDRFISYFPNLSKRNLPLLGVLAGNDFIKSNVLERICSQLPSAMIIENCGMSRKQFQKQHSKHQEKIIKVLYFLCDKTLEEAVNQICSRVARDHRRNLKDLIKQNLKVYDIPTIDDFVPELDKHLRSTYASTQGRLSEPEFEENYRAALYKVLNWLKRGFESSVVSYPILEMLKKNTSFWVAHMDDPRLPSAHFCRIRIDRVLLQLLRRCSNDTKPRVVFDRIGHTYDKILMKPLDSLEGLGAIDYTIYDVPSLKPMDRAAILLATLHCSQAKLSQSLANHRLWLDSLHAKEFTIIKILLDYIDVENQAYNFKLWKNFKKAVVLCVLYYFLTDGSDSMLVAKLKSKASDEDCVPNLRSGLQRLNLTGVPLLENGRRLYNCRLMHQITQLQSTISAYNLMNSFLGEALVRIRTEGWLNCCLVYNLTELFQSKKSNFHNRRSQTQLASSQNEYSSLDQFIETFSRLWSESKDCDDK